MEGARLSRKVIWVGLSIALCGFGLALYFLRSNGPGSEPVRDVSLERSAARGEPLDREPSVDVAQSQTPRAAENEKVNEPEAQAPVSLPAPMAQALESMGRQVQTSSPAVESERAFAAEPADPNWARDMEARITGELASISRSGMITMQVDCRTSTCRVLLAQQVELDPRQPGSPVLSLYDELFRRLGYPSRPVQMAIDRSGVATSLVYLPGLRPSNDGNAAMAPVQGE